MQYHIHLAPDQIGRYVFLPGDPGRVPMIAQYLDEPRFVASNREFCTWEGLLDGERVAVTSTGIGGPSAAIALQELARIGCTTFIRLGTCGLLQPGHALGDLVLPTASVRGGATPLAYVPPEFPAVAHPELVWALQAAAREQGATVHTGIIHCKDAFFLEEVDTLPRRHQAETEWATWRRAGVLATEMESDTLFVLGSILGLRTGSLLLALGGLFGAAPLELKSPGPAALDRLIRCGIAGMRTIIQTDRSAQR